MNRTMAASDDQAEHDTMESSDGQEFTAVPNPGDGVEVTREQETGVARRFECLHCSKLYTTKKSLNRHLNGTKTACADRQAKYTQSSESQPKPRWACSRCGKDCATAHSVERHIINSCWRNCDECAGDGNTRCDSVVKVGACRSCEAKGIFCTKHTSAISGSVPQAWTDPAAHPQRATPVDENAAFITQLKPVKRKTLSSPEMDPQEALTKKRIVPAGQQIGDHSSGRIYNPLRSQAYVPLAMKEDAMSNWLYKQDEHPSSALSTQDQVCNKPTLLPQTSSLQTHQRSQQPDQFVEPSHIFDSALPPLADVLRSQHDYSPLTTGHEQTLQQPPQFQSYQGSSQGLAVSPYVSSIPSLQYFGCTPPSGVGGPVQPDNLFHQIQGTRQQNNVNDSKMERRFGPHTNVTLPVPLSLGGLLNPMEGVQTSQTQGAQKTPLPQTFTPISLSQNESVLTLRIHSNVYDRNGSPIFSILSICRDEIFGPHFDAYCATRGKEYGVHWNFVYQYQAATHHSPEQKLQITLTRDMTPNDIKDDAFPDMAMRNLDTIYVTQAKTLPLTETDTDMNESGTFQSSDPHMPLKEFNIIDGETSAYQNPDVSRHWYQAVEQDANHLRAVHDIMKSTIMQQKQQIFAKNKTIAQLQHSISQLTSLSAQLRERMQLPLPNPSSVMQAPTSHVGHQRPELERQQASPQHSRPNPTAFVTKCEAVREHQDQASQHLEPLQFPRFSGEFASTEYAHQSDTSSVYSTQFQHHGHVHDAPERVVLADSEEKRGEK